MAAAGAVAGCAGLIAFAACIWWLAPRLANWQTLGAAALAWIALSALAWLVRFRM